MQKLVVGATSNVIEVVRLRDSTSGDYISGATVTLQSIQTLAAANVSGQSYPSGMTEVEAGRYRITLASGLNVTAGQLYVVNCRATIGSISRDFSIIVLAVDPQDAP